MTDEIKAELLMFGNRYFTIPKNSWSSDELKDMYKMYNKIHNTDKVDSGCGSCRRDTITDVRNAYLSIKPQNPPKAII